MESLKQQQQQSVVLLVIMLKLVLLVKWNISLCAQQLLLLNLIINKHKFIWRL